MNELTREKVERECEWLTKEHASKSACMWSATDAALRSQLKAQTERADKAERQLGNRPDENTESKYLHELRGIVALPDYLPCSLVEFARSIKVLIEEESRNQFGRSHVVAVLCNAARVGWELCQVVRKDSEHACQLTAKLEAMTKERQRDALYGQSEMEELQRQLAASEARVKVLQRAISDGVASYTTLEQLHITVQQQLAEAQAEIARLEADNAAARGELGVSLDESPSGSLVNKLVIANRVLRGERNQLQATVTAQQEEIGRLREAARDALTLLDAIRTLARRDG